MACSSTTAQDRSKQVSIIPDLTFTDVEAFVLTQSGCTSTQKGYKYFAEPGYLHNIQCK